MNLSSNWYFDGSTSRYIISDYATLYQQDDGKHVWYTAPSGTAGNAISFTQAMTLDASGRLGIGTTSPTSLLHLYKSNATSQVTIEGAGVSNPVLYLKNPSGYTSYIQYNTAGSTGLSVYDVTANTDRLVINSSGNVGIGTSSPTSYSGFTTLSINNATNGGVIDLLTNDVRTATFFNTSTYTAIGTITNIPLYFYTNNSERMRITSSGNVGIGTSSPASKLHVSFLNDFDGVRIQNSNRGHSYLLTTAGSSAEFFSIYDIDNSQYLYQVGNIGHGFLTGGSARMVITSTGNVGIGTTSPSYKLDVAGDINISTGAFRSQGEIVIRRSGNEVRMGSGDGSDYLVYYAGASERMRITSVGEVYIAGTTDQGAYNLQVNGTGVWGAGAYVDGSDIKLKDNVKDLGSALGLIMNIKPKTFTYKPFYNESKATQVGFIAQELEEVLKDEVYKDGVIIQGKEYKGVAYQSLIPLLVKALQEQQAQIEELKKKVQ